jgi:hypothetical protein
VSLLNDIVRCRIATDVLRGRARADHPCTTIVMSQSVTDPAVFQVPEPWSGRLDRAPILFLCCKPSINEQEVYPRGFVDRRGN